MIKENIFIGQIRKKQRQIHDIEQTELETVYYVYEKDTIENENAILYKCYQNEYLEITKDTTWMDVALAELDMNDKTISTDPIVGTRYVNSESLKPYYKSYEDKKVSLKKFKKNNKFH